MERDLDKHFSTYMRGLTLGRLLEERRLCLKNVLCPLGIGGEHALNGVAVATHDAGR